MNIVTDEFTESYYLATPVITSTELPTSLFSSSRLDFQEIASTRSALQLSPEVRIPHVSVDSKLKRMIDILGASVGLMLTGFILIPIAIAIQIDNPGKIFYSQIRCGVNGRPFHIWKFRSMVTNADSLKHLVQNEAKGNIFKSKDDPRVTRVGRFLRRTSLDEFPQFWNVLRGEMSLVGTRPPTVDEVKTYEARHWKRLRVKPGITGEWQAHGRSNVKDFESIIDMDLEYQRKWSILYDLKLIFKTVAVVLKKDGAC
ncbi:MAG: sugar transferase [Leptolyngbya sp. Prado105]|nr:sugar transferase [Leptolyngbya sp. Prado105]